MRKNRKGRSRFEEGSGNVFADHFHRAGNGSHGDDNAQDSRDNAEARHGVAGLGQHADGRVMFLLHAADLHVQQHAQLIGLDLAVNDRTQRAA